MCGRVINYAEHCWKSLMINLRIELSILFDSAIWSFEIRSLANVSNDFLKQYCSCIQVLKQHIKVQVQVFRNMESSQTSIPSAVCYLWVRMCPDRRSDRSKLSQK